MKSDALQDKFLMTVHKKIKKKNSLINMVSDILHIEKESAYRRLTGRVSFSINEMGLIAKELGISIDSLINGEISYLWLPFQLENPLLSSMDVVFSKTDETLRRMGDITNEYAISGNICSSLPFEFFLYSPILAKFMFFKWGHYFVGGDEFNNYGQWKAPQQIFELHEKLKNAHRFDSIYYVWDDSLIWSLLNEVVYLYKMRIISKDEKTEIKEALRDMLTRLEHSLNGDYDSMFGVSPDIFQFYVSPRSPGFTSNYYLSESQKHFSVFRTNFTYCLIDNDIDNFNRLRNWVDSFKNISSLLSKSGRFERRIFIDSQFKLLDLLLDKDY